MVSYLRSLCLTTRSEDFSYFFLLEVLEILLGFSFRFTFYFELHVWYNVWVQVLFFFLYIFQLQLIFDILLVSGTFFLHLRVFLHMCLYLFQQHLMKGLFFSIHCIAFDICIISVDKVCEDLILDSILLILFV